MFIDTLLQTQKSVSINLPYHLWFPVVTKDKKKKRQPLKIVQMKKE